MDSFNPEGFVNASIDQFAQERPYINAVYLQGARFLAALRGVLGDEAFRAFLHDYTQMNDGGYRSSQMFFDLLPDSGSEALEAITANFFQQP